MFTFNNNIIPHKVFHTLGHLQWSLSGYIVTVYLKKKRKKGRSFAFKKYRILSLASNQLLLTNSEFFRDQGPGGPGDVFCRITINPDFVSKIYF